MITIAPDLTVDTSFPVISIVDPPIFSVPLFVSEQTQTVSIEPVNSENTGLQDCHVFTGFITAMSQQQPHFTLKDVRGMLANQFEIFDSRFDFLFNFLLLKFQSGCLWAISGQTFKFLLDLKKLPDAMSSRL